MKCGRKKISTYNLEQLNLKPKRAVPLSPKNLPKGLTSFTPGNQQINNLQTAAMTRGASPLNDHDDTTKNNNSGIVGKVSAKKEGPVPCQGV